MLLAGGVDAAAHELADAVIEKMHPHHKELDAEIEQVCTILFCLFARDASKGIQKRRKEIR